MGLIECLCLFQLWTAWSEPVAEHHLSADESPDLCSQEEQGQQWVTPILKTARCSLSQCLNRQPNDQCVSAGAEGVDDTDGVNSYPPPDGFKLDHTPK